MKIYITRHGQTEWNALRKIQGKTDIELNDTGRSQAELTGKKLMDKKIDLIITSPLKRAKETAEIINKYFNTTIIEDTRLVERGYGDFEGVTLDELKIIKENNPILNEIGNYAKNINVYNMETIHDLCDRVYEFLDEISQKYEDKNVLLVTHGNTSVPIKCYCMQYPLEDLVDRKTIKTLGNCEVVEFDI